MKKNLVKKPDSDKKTHDRFYADLAKVPGLRKDIIKWKLETGSKNNAELMARMSFAYRHIKTIDFIYKLVIKPDHLIRTKKELILKRIYIKLFKFNYATDEDINDLMLDAMLETKEEFDKKQDNHKED
jgi:hypothetical protein